MVKVSLLGFITARDGCAAWVCTSNARFSLVLLTSSATSGVNASSRLGGRTTEWGGVWEGNTPPHTGLRLSERRATNIGLLYPEVRDNIGGIFPLTSPNQIIAGCVPGIPGGVDASVSYAYNSQRIG